MKPSRETFINILLKSIFPSEDGDLQFVLRRLLCSDALQLSDLQIARDVIKESDIQQDRRPAAYLFLAAMLLSCHDKNTFLKRGDIAQILKNGCYLEDDPEGNKACHNKINALIDASIADYLSEDYIVRKEDACYFRRDYNDAESLSAKLSALVSDAGYAVDNAVLEHAMEFVFKNGKSLNDEQKNAVRTAVAKRFTVITGGPGTGKTTIVCAILRALLSGKAINAQDIALVAPTGRAAQRMGEALKDQCANAIWNPQENDLKSTIESMTGSTIHSLLGGYKPDFTHNADNRLKQKLIVVDEASMVDVELMNALVSAMSNDCHMILLGDKDQLPSVESGAVLGDIVSDTHQGIIVTLTQSCRFSGELKESAEAINAGDCAAPMAANFRIDSAFDNWKALAAREDGAFRWYESKQGSAESVHEIIRECWLKSNDFQHLIELAKSFPRNDVSILEGTQTEASRELFGALAKTQILTVVRDGALGVNGINEMLLKECTKKKNIESALLQCPGVPVIVTRNTKERGLFNGDMGITVNTDNGMAVLFERGEKVLKCPVTLLPEHELAYAITVHKSQGSEYGHVLVVLPDDPNNPLLCRQLLYTGITRAKKCAVIIGTQAAYLQAIQNRLIRNSGITLG